MEMKLHKLTLRPLNREGDWFNYDSFGEHLMSNLFKKYFGRGITSPNGSKRSRKIQRSADYQSLEPRKLLATLTVDTLSDVVDLNDGLVSLREAITAANTNAAYGDAVAGEADGDIIRFDSAIVDGTIELSGSQLEIADDLIIRGGGVTIDALSQSRMFSIDATEQVSISHLNLSNGSADSGGAIEHLADGRLQLSNVQFTNNHATSQGGGAINKVQGVLAIGNSNFEENFAGRGGGAISVEGGQLNIFRSAFANNHTRFGGGAILAVDSNLFSTEAEFLSNESGSVGGAVSFGGVDSLAIFSLNTLDGNRASVGGAIFLGGRTDGYVFSSTLSNNSAGRTMPIKITGSGGAISTQGELVVRDSTITGNRSIGSAGGGGIFLSRGNARLTNTIISSNRVLDGAGGGIRSSGADLTVIDSTISENRTNISSSDTFLGGGGGINFDDMANTVHSLVVRNTTLQGNVSAEAGGAIYTSGGNTSIFDSNIENNVARGQGFLAGSGGGVTTTFGGNLDIVRSEISGNRLIDNSADKNELQEGGGIQFAGSVFNLIDSEITSNFSLGNGGGLSIVQGRATIVNSDISHNIAGDGTKPKDEAIGNGGGIFLSGSPSLEIFGGTLVENTAHNRGGGIFSNQRGSFDFSVDVNSLRESTEFTGNRAQRFDGGGVFFEDDGNASFHDAIFEDNAARSGAAIATKLESSTVDLRLIDVVNTNNVSRRDDGGYSIGDEVTFTETSAAFDELDLAISELDDLSTIV